MQKSFWNFREARVALFIIEFYVVLTHPTITCSMLTIETNCQILQVNNKDTRTLSLASFRRLYS